MSKKINEEDPDRQMQFCEVMEDLCNQNPRFPVKLFFSNCATYLFKWKSKSADIGVKKILIVRLRAFIKRYGQG